MTKPAINSQLGPSTGQGRRAIPSDVYLLRWSHIVEALKAGQSTPELKRTHGICAETVRHIRRFMMEEGWTPPKREPAEIVRPVREPAPPRVGMTAEKRLQKYSGVALWLRAGKTMAQAAEQEGVSVNTVQVVRRALVAQGEAL